MVIVTEHEMFSVINGRFVNSNESTRNLDVSAIINTENSP